MQCLGLPLWHKITQVLNFRKQYVRRRNVQLRDIGISTNFSCAGHPRFFNQLSCGLDLISMAGEWLTATANTNMFTYEIAPVFILMEHVVMEKMREIIGYQGGDSILAPGK
jgi:glutamate/tyrosine decarboxylase-like PLP-dependent enzyme